MAKLIIKMDGLSVMAPDKPYPMDKNNGLWVLLIDAKNHPQMPHNPFLEFPFGTHPQAWRLGEEHIDLKILRGGKDVTRQRNLHIIRDRRKRQNGKPTNQSPQQDEHGDFSWVPSIQEIVPQATLDPEFLQDEPGKHGVAGRLKISDGTLEVDVMAEDGGTSPEIQVFEFKHKGASRVTQAIAEGVIVKIDIQVGDIIQFSARELKDQSSPTRQAIELQSTNQKPDIEIRLHNRPGHGAASGHFPLLFDLLHPRLDEKPTMDPRSLSSNANPAQHHHTRRADAVEIQAQNIDGKLELYRVTNPDACPFVQYP